MSQLIDQQGNPLIAPTQRRGLAPSAEFMRGSGAGGAGARHKWKPCLREIDDDVANGWETAAARTVDLGHNSGWIAGMFDQAVANTVGRGLRLTCAPENDLFGQNEAEARRWRTEVERRFGLWAENAIECDITGKMTFGRMQDAAFRSWLTTGETLGEIVWRKRFGSPCGTKVRLLPPSRLSMETYAHRRIYSGVEHDRDGLPVAYWANRRRDESIGSPLRRILARDSYGRPRVIHVMLGQAEQSRGITPLVPVIKVAQQFDQLADSTLMASLIQSVFAANVSSSGPTEEVMAGLLAPQELARLNASGVSPFEAWAAMQSGWYDSNVIDVGINGRVTNTFPGEKLEFLSPDQPTSNYPDFARLLLREMARCLGMTYESATGDYAGATYSSVRMAVNEIFQITLARRQFVVIPFCQPIYEAWLEDEVASGRMWFPGGYENFLANRLAASRAKWIGSPKPQADDLKTAKAHEIYRRMGVVTDQQIASDLGVDIDDVYAQRAREAEMRATYGLPEPVDPAAGHESPPNSDEDETNG